MQYLSEEFAVIGTIDPATVTSEVFSDVIDMSKYDKVVGIALLGNMASDSAATFRVATCAAAGTTVVSLKTAAATSAGDDNKQIVIEVDNNDLAGGTVLTADRYVKFGLTATNSGGLCAVVVLGKAKYGPSSDGDLSTVVEIETDKD